MNWDSKDVQCRLINVVLLTDVDRQQGECERGRRGVCEGQHQGQDDRGAGSPQGELTPPHPHPQVFLVTVGIACTCRSHWFIECNYMIWDKIVFMWSWFKTTNKNTLYHNIEWIKTNYMQCTYLNERIRSFV